MNWSSIAPKLPSEISLIDNEEVMKTMLSTHPRVSWCWVEVILLDANDNSPQLTKHRAQLTLPEDLPVGTILEHFPASDVDSVST